MISIEEKIHNAGYILPSFSTPAGMYIPAIRSGNLVFTSGQLPLKEGTLIEPGGKGKVNELNQHYAVQAAKTALLNALAAVRSVTGNLDLVERIIKLTVFVASDSLFNNQHIVANGASSLLQELFGEQGIHVRSAVGVAELPLDASLEIELIVECKSCTP